MWYKQKMNLNIRNFIYMILKNKYNIKSLFLFTLRSDELHNSLNNFWQIQAISFIILFKKSMITIKLVNFQTTHENRMRRPKATTRF